MSNPDYSKCIFVVDPKLQKKRQQKESQQKKRVPKTFLTPLDFTGLYQLQLRVDTLNNLLNQSENQVITLQQLRKTQEEIKDFKRFLEHTERNPDQWMKYLD